MPTKMRLQRHGKKGRPFFHIVIADGRAPRDGKFIERLGTYNPLANPADINLDFDRTLNWLKNGAEPTETVRAILSYKGILLKYHLLKGVTKGALTEEQAEAKFQEWLSEKESKINQKKRELELAGKSGHKKRLEAEEKIKMAKSEAIAKKLAKAAEAEAGEVEEAVAEEEPAVEAAAEQVAEAPQAQAEATPVAEETPQAEAEIPAATDETPAEGSEPEAGEKA